MNDHEFDQTMDGTPVPRAMRNPPRILPASEEIRRIGCTPPGEKPQPVDRSGDWNQLPETESVDQTPPEDIDTPPRTTTEATRP